MEKLISEFSVGLFFWQLVIFVSLIFLLRKFAWKPILSAVEERETKISDALDLAEKTKLEMAQRGKSSWAFYTKETSATLQLAPRKKSQWKKY